MRRRDFAFAALAELKAGGLVIANETFFASRSEQLAALTLRHRVPAVHQSREFVSAGGLLSYGGVSGNPTARLGPMWDGF